MKPPKRTSRCGRWWTFPLPSEKSLPANGKLFAEGEGDIDHLSQTRISLRRFVANGFFDEIKRAHRHTLDKRYGFSGGEAMVIVNAQGDAGTDLLT